MSHLFVTHLQNQNQINQADAIQSLIIIFLILMLAIILTVKRKLKVDETFLSLDTGNALRGIAIIFLIFGHLAIKCIEGELFFEYAGKWAVIIFLYISGIALTKTYGLATLQQDFLLKRFRRLAVPVWIALCVYYSLDYLILNNSYSIKKMCLNYFGIINLSPPSEAAWFVTYIIFLYLTYFIVSKIKVSTFNKVIILFSISYLCTFFIWHNKFLNAYFGIWTQYTFVFPAAVLVGLFRVEIRNILSKLFNHPVCYCLIIALFLYQYFSAIGVDSVIVNINSAIFSQVLATIQPMPLIISLVMISHLLDKFSFRSAMLNWLGRYSLEIFLLHLPFLLYYDFFLFRKPLYLFFFVYLFVVLSLSILLNKFSSKINFLFFNMPTTQK